MKRLFLVGVITTLLVAMVSISWAATNLNSSRSNVYRVVGSADGVTPAQVAAIRNELEKNNPKGDADVPAVQAILRKLGINAPNLLIRIDKTTKPPTIQILTPADAQAGLAVSDPGTPGDKAGSKSSK